jgi:Trk K+ transport system NAD-binding subunit
MKIIILGAGQVGSSVLNSLASEANDIVVVDTQTHLLRDLQDRYDIATVQGNAAHPTVLDRAGAHDADMLIAVTSDDETNMLACQIAHILFKIPKKIARVRALEYLRYRKLFGPEAIPIDVVISPVHSLRHGEAEAIEAIAHGERGQSEIVGQRIDQIKLPAGVVMGALVRGEDVIQVHHDTVIEDGDHVIMFLHDKKLIRVVEKLFHAKGHSVS